MKPIEKRDDWTDEEYEEILALQRKYEGKDQMKAVNSRFSENWETGEQLYFSEASAPESTLADDRV